MKLLAASLAALISAVALLIPVVADDNVDTIDVFVSPKLIAITVTGADPDYGSQPLGSPDARPDPEGFTITNVGSVAVDLLISGDHAYDATSGVQTWTLGSTAGLNTFVHRFSLDPTPDLGDFQLLELIPKVFMNDVGPRTSTPGSGEVDVKLSMALPTESDSLAVQRTRVTITAME